MEVDSKGEFEYLLPVRPDDVMKNVKKLLKWMFVTLYFFRIDLMNISRVLFLTTRSNEGDKLFTFQRFIQQMTICYWYLLPGCRNYLSNGEDDSRFNCTIACQLVFILALYVSTAGVLVDENARMAAPTEQPGMRRTHEIKLLYGEQSLKVR